MDELRQESKPREPVQSSVPSSESHPNTISDLKALLGIRFGKQVENKSLFKQVCDDWRYLRKEYGMNLSLSKLNAKDEKSLLADRMTFEEAVEAVKILRQEISKYPPSYVKSLDITRFRVLETLTRKNFEDDESIGGTANYEGEIYVANGDIESFYRQTIHHEISHRADYEQSELRDKIPFIGWLLDEIKDEMFDADWAKLNPKGKDVYLRNNWRRYREMHPGVRPKGFIRPYGSKNQGEDRATIAEILMTNPQYLFRLNKNDKVLHKKTHRMIELYKQRTNGLMDEAYFADLAAGRLKEGYWQGR